MFGYHFNAMNEKILNLLKTSILRLRCMFRHHSADRISPDPSVWIFSSTDNRSFNYNSRYLFLYVKDHCPRIRPRFVINDDKLRAKLKAQYGPDYFIETKSETGIRTVLNAGVWFTSAGMPVYGTGLSRNRRIINLWHGVPLKTIALCDRSESRISKRYFKCLFSDNYTDVAATSPAVSRVMRRSLGVSEEKMRIWGQPRCDCLFEPFDRAAFFRSVFPELSVSVTASGSSQITDRGLADVPDPGQAETGFAFRKAVLYAPTFRSKKAVRLFPFSDFDRERLEDFLEQEDVLLCIRMHPAACEGARPAESFHIRFLNEDKLADVTEALAAFDLLITDYSSIYIDYLLLDRPVIFLPYDLEEYRRSHGFSFPYEKVTPGPKPDNMEDFLEAMKRALDTARPDGYEKQRRVIRRLFYENPKPCCAVITEEVSRMVF